MANTGRELADRMRDRIVSALHLGQLRAGDRLPSIREASREFGVDHRVVAQVYRLLEAEGLAEIRTRSGIYVAKQEMVGDTMLTETVGWLAGVLTGAVQRRIPVNGFADLVRRSTTSVCLRCACVESTRDQVIAYCTELERDLGLHPVEVLVPPGPDAGGADPGSLRERLADADLVVTTGYHARTVREAAEPLGKPIVMITVHPDLIRAVERQLSQGSLTVVAVDPAFGERIRAMYGGVASSPEQIRVVRADDRRAVGKLDPSEPVLLTRAAHEQLGEFGPPLLFPHSPTLSPDTVRRISAAMIRLNMEAVAN